MKNIVDTITSDNKNTFEGFFDNVDANPFKALDDFLKDNKQRIVTLKGKDYLIYNLLIFDVDDLREVVRNLIDRTNIKINKDLKKYRVVTKIKWIDPYLFSKPSSGISAIEISYKFYTLVNIENGTEPQTSYYRFDAVARKDEYLIDFLKKIAK